MHSKHHCSSNKVEEVYLHPHLKDVCLHHLLLLLPLAHKHREDLSQTHGLMNTGLVAPEKAGGARIPGILFLHWALQRRHRWQPYLKCQLGIFFFWWLKQSVVLCETGSTRRGIVVVANRKSWGRDKMVFTQSYYAIWRIPWAYMAVCSLVDW